jgi:hypothetical protein
MNPSELISPLQFMPGLRQNQNFIYCSHYNVADRVRKIEKINLIVEFNWEFYNGELIKLLLKKCFRILISFPVFLP